MCFSKDIFYPDKKGDNVNFIRENLSIRIEFTETEFKILENDLRDPLQWIEDLVVNKLANRKSALVDIWSKKFQTEKSVESVPTDEAQLLNLIFNQPDYKNRRERDAFPDPAQEKK